MGDEVRYNDQIKFESLKTKGQFLHCSNHRYRDKFHVLELWLVYLFNLNLNLLATHFNILEKKNSYELNLSATESALTIVPHYRPMPSHDRKAFRVGDAKLHNNNTPGSDDAVTVALG